MIAVLRKMLYFEDFDYDCNPHKNDCSPISEDCDHDRSPHKNIMFLSLLWL